MTEQNPNPVVVAVGHEPIDAALAFAADEATREGCGLHLVHAVHHLAQGPEMPLVAETDLERVGRAALTAALDRAHRLVPDAVLVTTEQRVGTVVSTLVELAPDAHMIVLEHRHLSRMRRVITRSVASGVAARARVPVVSVPSHWSDNRARGQDPVVSVGVDDPARAEQVLRAAAAEARSRGAVLQVLHTWTFPNAAGDLFLNRIESKEWSARAKRGIQETLDSFEGVATGLTVRIDARHGHAADALIEASKESELLVVGRHDPVVPFGSHLGPIARAVLREAECPVLLVDPRPVAA